MSGPLSVSMTIRLIDEFSAGAAKLTGVVRDLKAAGDAFNDTPMGRPADWTAETAAVQGVIAKVGELKAATAEAAPIGGATAQFEAEAVAIEGVIAKVAALKAAEAEAVAPIAGGTAQFEAEAAAVEGVIAKVAALKAAEAEAAAPIGAATAQFEAEAKAVEAATKAMHDLKTATAEAAAAGAAGVGEEPSGMTPDGSFDWQGMKAPPHKGPIPGLRASEWVAQQTAIEEADAAATRASEHIRGLEEDMARLGMAGMAFGQLRGFGEGLRKPIEAMDDAFEEFQAKTQDLATRSENNGGQATIGDHILKVAREANVPWQQVYEGEQSLASLGGGKQLQAMGEFETRMNKLALAGHIEASDIYSAMMHYIKGGLSAAEAMDTLEQQHVQGKRGSVELNQLARFMPSVMALGKEFGMTPQQAATDTAALMQIMRENVGTAGEASTLVRHAMTKLGDPRTMKRLESDLGIDGFAVRADAKARGENPLFALLDAVADKFAAMTLDQKGTVTKGENGTGTVSGGDPKIMGDLARDYYFRAALDAYIQHRAELPEFTVPVEEARRTTDEDYAAQNTTVKQARQAAANAKAEAEIRAGRTQEGLMKMAAGAQGGIWDAGGWVAQTMPGTTGVVGAGTGLMGSALTAMGRLGEAAVGLATTYKAAQWVGAKYPAVGNVGQMMMKGPYDLATGFAQGIRDGASQGLAEAAGKAAAEGAGKVAAEPAAAPRPNWAPAAAPASVEFGAASTSLGAIAMLFAWGAQKDMLGPEKFPHLMGGDKLRRAGTSGIHLPGDIAEDEGASRSSDRPPPVASAVPNIPVTASVTAAVDAAFKAHQSIQPQPVPTAAPTPQTVTNNNQKYITAPISVPTSIVINATLSNTTPGAIGNVVAGAVAQGVRAGSAALHDGTETK